MSIDRSFQSPHRIVVCTLCRRDGDDCNPGHALIDELKAKFDSASRSSKMTDFEVSGIDCMAGCTRPCTVAFTAADKASYLFGDIDPEKDIDSLIAFADQFQRSGDGWTRATDRPLGLRNKTLARLPGSLVLSRLGAGENE